MDYLTQIIIDKKVAIRNGFKDTYAWHQAITQSFAHSVHGLRPFLSRIDDRHSYYKILILSNQRPQMAEWGQWQTKKIDDKFLNHTYYRFELRANPTVKRVVRDNAGHRIKNGRRTAICNEQELLDWIHKKGKQAGFEICDCDASAPLPRLFFRKGKMGKHSSVDFRGVLKVFDPELFKKSFNHGIGPAKAFGFGMLLLKPLQSKY